MDRYMEKDRAVRVTEHAANLQARGIHFDVEAWLSAESAARANLSAESEAQRWARFGGWAPKGAAAKA